jgi:hypothetical protein
MAAPKLVNAKWVAGYPARLVDGTELIPGETVVAIPKSEAEESDNWEPQGGKVSQEQAAAAPERTGVSDDEGEGDN